jgi:hypothetical protein
MYAHIHNRSKRDQRFPLCKYVVTISSDCEMRSIINTHGTADKREARELARQYNAQLWNF